jgi:hypothetical protein
VIIGLIWLPQAEEEVYSVTWAVFLIMLALTCIGHAGGLILLNPNATQHLPAAVTAAFLATLYADYLKAADIPVLECGPYWFPTDDLRNFSRSQVIVIIPHILHYIFSTQRCAFVVSNMTFPGRLRTGQESSQHELRRGLRGEIPCATAPPRSLLPQRRQALQLRARVAVEGPQPPQPTRPGGGHGRRA